MNSGIRAKLVLSQWPTWRSVIKGVALCDMQNVYKNNIVKVLKEWCLSRDRTWRSWKAFQQYILKGQDLKIFCSRNVLKMTWLWSSKGRRDKGIDFTTVLFTELREEVDWVWVLLHPGCAWAKELHMCRRQQMAGSLVQEEEPQVGVGESGS